MSKEKLFEYMEDFDNAELSDYEWEEQLREAIMDFNCDNRMDYPVKPTTIVQYKSWKRDKYKPDM